MALLLQASIARQGWQAALRATSCAPAAASTFASGLHTSVECLQSSAAPGAKPGAGIIEMRSYTVAPSDFATYVALTTSYGEVRKELLPFLGMFTCDVGEPLHKLVHLYAYKSYEERESIRRAAARDARWQRFISEGRKFVQHQTSSIFREAAPIYSALKLPATIDFKSPAKGKDSTARPMYELRQYQLHAGYGSVPKLVEAFSKGLPAKVAADPTHGKLALFGFSEVGTLNRVVELWRFNSTADCIKAREAARAVPTWREAVGAVTPGVLTFTTEFLHPTSFSPWQ